MVGVEAQHTAPAPHRLDLEEVRGGAWRRRRGRGRGVRKEGGEVVREELNVSSALVYHQLGAQLMTHVGVVVLRVALASTHALVPRTEVALGIILWQLDLDGLLGLSLGLSA